MRKLMMTTALVASASLGASLAAQADTHQTMATESGQMHAMVPAFLSSEFTGMTLHAVDPDIAVDAQASSSDDWEDVGSINDIVMTQDGAIRGVLIDVGGFLGFGARTVMVDMADITFVPDAEAPEGVEDFLILATLSRDALEALPEWSDDMLRAGFAPRVMDAGGTPEPMDQAAAMGSSAPAAATVSDDASAAVDEGRIGTPGGRAEVPEGYTVVDASVPTAEQILSADVHDAMGDSIGTVNDVILHEEHGVQEVIVDIGGFLGIGSHSVALPVDGADILWNAQDDSVRIHLPMTREQLESLPEYES